MRHALFALHFDEVIEVVEGGERGGGGDIVDEEVGVGLEGGGGPEAAVLFLAGCVCAEGQRWAGRRVGGICTGKV